MESALAAAYSAIRAAQSRLDYQEVVKAAQERIIGAEEAGRRKVARDLHDGVQQRLIALSMELGRANADRSPQELEIILKHGRHEVQQIMEEVRLISRGIHPPMLIDSGLAGAFEDIAERLGMQLQIDIQTHTLPPAVELAVFYALSEALTNCHKHARAASVHVKTWRGDNAVLGEVRDDGVGGAMLKLGGGLHGAEDRIKALRGDFHVRSDHTGTTVRVSIPLT